MCVWVPPALATRDPAPVTARYQHQLPQVTPNPRARVGTRPLPASATRVTPKPQACVGTRTLPIVRYAQPLLQINYVTDIIY